MSRQLDDQAIASRLARMTRERIAKEQQLNNTFSPAPNPVRAPKEKAWSSIAPKSHAQKLEAAAKLRAGSQKKRVAKGRKPIAKKPRKPSETQRIYGPKGFREHLHQSACLLCGYRGESIQQAHLHTGGIGRKDNWQNTGPLCGSRLAWGGWIIGCHQTYDGAKATMLETVASLHRVFLADWFERETFASRSNLSVPEHR